MKKHCLLFYVMAICFCLFQACSPEENTDEEPAPPPVPGNNLPELSKTDWNLAADTCSKVLTKRFWNPAHFFDFGADGLNTNFMYWHQAQALDGLVDAYERSNDPYYKDYIFNWYEGVKERNSKDDLPGWNVNFKNDYIDDMEWIALAMLRAYEATDDERYLAVANDLWYNSIKVFWNDYAGGGISWKQRMLNSKNACSNGPACILACRMYKLNNREEDKEMALRIFKWMLDVLYNSSTGAVYDCVIDNGAEGLQFNKGTTTYNQGTFIGSAVELYNITGESRYLNFAKLSANFTMKQHVLPDTQILEGTDDSNCGIFAGIFVRYFIQLIMTEGLDTGSRNSYMLFLDKNAVTAWNDGRSKDNNLFSSNWTIPPKYNYTSMQLQLNGCMLIEARALLQRYLETITE